MSQAYYLIAFNSINHANYFESEIRKYGHKVIMIETPEYLTKDYYVALKITEDALPLAREKLRETNLKRFKIYRERLVDGKKTHEEVTRKKEEYDNRLLEMLFSDEGIEQDDCEKKIFKATDVTEKTDDKRKNKGKFKAYNVVSMKTKENNEQAKKKDIIEKKTTLKSSEKKLVREQKTDPVELIRKLIDIGKKANRL